MSEQSTERTRPFLARLAAIAPFFIGYALLDAWSQEVFSEPFFAFSTTFDQMLKYAAAVLPGPFLIALAPRVAPLVRRRYRDVLYLFGLVAATGTAILLLIMQGAIGVRYIAIAYVALSMARMCLMVCWLEKLTTCRFEDVWLCLASAIALGAVVNFGISILPDAPGNALFIVMPLASAILLRWRHYPADAAAASDAPSSRRGGEDASATPSQAMRACPPAQAPSFRGMFSAVPIALIVVLGLVNIPSEALVVVELDAYSTAFTVLGVLTNALVRLGVNLAAIGLAFVAVRTNIKMTFYVAIPVILVVAVLLALGFDTPVSILHTVSRIGSEMIRYIITYLLIRCVLERSVPAMFCFALMTTSLAGGSLLGFLVACALGDNSVIMAFAFTTVLVMAMLFAFAAQDKLDRDPAMRPAASGANAAAVDAIAPAAPETPEASMERFAERYELTQRERDVLELWVSGHTTAFIEEQLCISKYTVKSHVKHIYEKTGTNSKESLILLYEGFRTER